MNFILAGHSFCYFIVLKLFLVNDIKLTLSAIAFARISPPPNKRSGAAEIELFTKMNPKSHEIYLALA
jgi:hypothetical protein